MREIKFRAWHNKRKKFYKVLILNLKTVLNGGIWVICLGRNPIEDKDIHIRVQHNDCIIEQYTGLKDKTGKEIYDGDIVSTFICFGPGGQEKRNIEVAYDRLGQISIQLWVFNEDIKAWPEIIGNIHENPELLRKT
jgi:uncharacterized phage protein (TIGR01671 family)